MGAWDQKNVANRKGEAKPMRWDCRLCSLAGVLHIRDVSRKWASGKMASGGVC
jgi:hypothetical protein